jgi:hypothetical protein
VVYGVQAVAVAVSVFLLPSHKGGEASSPAHLHSAHLPYTLPPHLRNMDPLSITASVVTLIGAAKATIAVITNLCDLYGNAGPLVKATKQVREHISLL